MNLGVNIDHVATLREARYRGRPHGEPDVVEAARICEAAGVHGITVHLREDRRHIQDRDVWRLKQTVRTRLNLEMANVPEIIDIALKLKPATVCLVPERRQEVTTEGGLDVVGNLPAITELCRRMKGAGIEVSLFIAPDPKQIDASAKTGAQFIELHTGAYAEAFAVGVHASASSVGVHASACPGSLETEFQRLLTAAEQGNALGLRINAGHGLNYDNVPRLHALPQLEDLNIGHSIVSRSLFVGLETAVKQMLNLIQTRPS